MSVAFTLALRELRGGLRGFGIFLLCLALGVAAIAAVGTVRSAILQGITEQGAVLLGGDAQLEFTYRFANDAERDWMIKNASQVSEIVEFRSMAVAQIDGIDERALTQVKAIDDLYPLAGQMELEPAIDLAEALGTPPNPGAVMEAVLAARLGLDVGETFFLGLQEFTLSALIAREPDSAGGGFGLGPRTLVRTAHLENAGLIGPGTLFSTKYRLMLPDPTRLAELQSEAETAFENSGLRWQDARNGAPGVQAFVDRLGSFLILVGLSGLAVGGIGVSAAVSTYLARKTAAIATLKTLGARRNTIFAIYFIQIGILTLIGLTIGVVVGAGLPMALAPLIQDRLPVPAEFRLYPRPIFEAISYGILAALIFTLWPLSRTENVRATALYRDALGGTRQIPRLPYLLALIVLVIALVGVAAIFSDNLWLTGWTAAGILGALAILAVVAAGLKQASRYLSKGRLKTGTRLALGAIGGPKSEATSVVLSLGLGLSVLAAIGQVDGTLRNAISGNLPEVAPSYFFVDIQNDQLDGFKTRLGEDPAVSRVETAPMLRGVISQINGKPARDVAGDHWVIDGDRGVTYAGPMPSNTVLTQGEWWAEDYDGPPLISFADEEAEEMGIALGDTLTVNILGRDITGTVASLREVDFSTAGIGFILAMNQSALAGAPHTHIATVYAEQSAEAEILRDLSTSYPNITAISVRDAINRVAGLLGSLAAATSYGASATLLTGFMVLIGAAAAGEGARVYEAAILKTLGANRRQILASFVQRSLILGLSAGAIALFVGCLAGWAVANYVFETDYKIFWGPAIAIILGGILATLATGLWFSWRPLSSRPAQVLRAQQ
ncbi:ABC transporter permease [Algirhabdus cladophorae]|uniref:ABC transporter permease n=1 Tax=Algirhabdus cladophorae TaxID=3377108 RepID=UPI003B848831